MRATALLCAACACLIACDREPSRDASSTVAPDSAAGVVNEAVQPLFDGLGNLHFAITTNSPEAQSAVALETSGCGRIRVQWREIQCTATRMTVQLSVPPSRLAASTSW